MSDNDTLKARGTSAHRTQTCKSKVKEKGARHIDEGKMKQDTHAKQKVNTMEEGDLWVDR